MGRGEGEVCRMSFDNAKLQVPAKHPIKKHPGSDWKYKSKPQEREVGWTDVGVMSIGKAIKAM